MDENKMIRPMDFVRLTNIDESNVIKDTKNHGNYIPVYTSLPITITNNHKLYKYYIC